MTAPSLFRPQALEARREAWLGQAQLVQPLPVKLVSIVCVSLVSAIALFVAFGTYTRRVHAQGVLAPATGLITVASPTAGRLSSAAVSEGQAVSKGQLLYVVDIDAMSADGPTQQRVLVQLNAQKESVERQRKVRISVAVIQKKTLSNELINTTRQRDGTARQITLQTQLTQSLKNRADELSRAFGNGLARASDVQNQNFLYIEANSQLAQFEQSGIQLEGKVEDLESKLAIFDSDLDREVAGMDRTVAQFKQQIAESEARHAIEVRAPADGVLTSLRVHAGQQVPAGGTLLTLLPSKGVLQANLFVDSSAIGFIDKGEPVMLRYAAFPFQRFGLYRGAVSEVTRAPVGVDAPSPDEKVEPLTREGLYRITVKPAQPYVLAGGERRTLEAGMRVDADIAIEKRPLYRWLLDPAYRLKRSATLVTQGGTR